VEPTRKRVEVLFVAILGIDDGKASYENISWGRVSVLAQTGLLKPSHLPVVGLVRRRRREITGCRIPLSVRAHGANLAKAGPTTA
jgi:hypothetical protein